MVVVGCGEPQFNGDFRIIGPADPSYNCIAHVLGRHEWVQPSGESYDAFFVRQGYTRCAADEADMVFYSGGHVSLRRGKVWTSKLGKNVLIEHDSVDDLTGHSYGRVESYWRRTRG